MIRSFIRGGAFAALGCAALLGASLLAGCASDPNNPNGPPVISIPTIDPNTIAQVQAVATEVCGFVPTAATIASIIATFTGGGAIVDIARQAANGICAAVTAKGARRGGVQYRGVKIDGHFVN